eukprot:8621080-Pyramimonas_sp.AAC.1
MAGRGPHAVTLRGTGLGALPARGSTTFRRRAQRAAPRSGTALPRRAGLLFRPGPPRARPAPFPAEGRREHHISRAACDRIRPVLVQRRVHGQTRARLV